MITTPENLSKDRLKAELKKKGIKFNHNENKGYYVELYRDKVMYMGAAFSDDDIQRSPKVSKRKATTSRKVPASTGYPSTLPQIKNLSDEELKDELHALGEDPGPVNALTRNVYERKLGKLWKKNTKKNTPIKKYAVQRTPPSLSSTTMSTSSASSQESCPCTRSAKAAAAADDSFMAEWSAEDESDVETTSEEDNKIGTKIKEEKHIIPEPPNKHLVNLRRKSYSDGVQLWHNFFVLLAAFAVVFLLYEHFTVPAGQPSLIVMSLTYVKRMLIPSAERQVVEGSTASDLPPPPPPPPPPPAEAPPPSTEAPPQEEATPPPTEPPPEETTPPPTEPPQEETTPPPTEPPPEETTPPSTEPPPEETTPPPTEPPQEETTPPPTEPPPEEKPTPSEAPPPKPHIPKKATPPPTEAPPNKATPPPTEAPPKKATPPPTEAPPKKATPLLPKRRQKISHKDPPPKRDVTH